MKSPKLAGIPAFPIGSSLKLMGGKAKHLVLFGPFGRQVGEAVRDAWLDIIQNELMTHQ